MRPTTQELLCRADVLDFSDPGKWVSSTSRLRDPQWQLDSSTPSVKDGRVTLYWMAGSEVPTGEAPEEADAAIDLDCRKLVWTAMADQELRAAKKVRGALQLGMACASLRQFMREHGLASFEDLTPAVVLSYEKWLEAGFAAEVTESIARGQSQDQEGASDPSESLVGNALASRIYRRLLLIATIWSLRRTLERVGVPVPKQDPLAGRTASEVAGVLAGRIDDAIPPVPDEVFVPIMNACASLLLDYGAVILAAQALWLKHGGNGLPKRSGRVAAAAELTGFALLAPSRKPLRMPRTWTEDVEKEGSVVFPATGLRRLIVALRDACLLLIVATAGLRLGEVLAVPGGRRHGARLPDCIVRKRSENQLVDIFVLVSRVEKEHSVAVVDEWLLGSAPAGSQTLPLAVQAVVMLEDLMSPWRPFAKDAVCGRSLAVGFSSGGGLPNRVGTVVRLTDGVFTHSSTTLTRFFVDLSHIPDRSARGVDLVPYRETKGGCIRLAQYRKSYGKFVMRVDSRLLPALKKQFKHMAFATTQRSYLGRLAGELLDGGGERQQLSGFAFRAMLDSDAPHGGRLQRIIEGDIDRLSLPRPGSPEAEANVEAFIQSGGMLWGGEHGNCGIALAPLLSRCNRLAGTASFANVVPNQEFRSPKTCGGCPLNLVDASHIPFWRRRYLVNERIWRQACRRGLQADFRLAELRSSQAKAMLARLGWKGRKA